MKILAWSLIGAVCFAAGLYLLVLGVAGLVREEPALYPTVARVSDTARSGEVAWSATIEYPTHLVVGSGFWVDAYISGRNASGDVVTVPETETVKATLQLPGMTLSESSQRLANGAVRWPIRPTEPGDYGGLVSFEATPGNTVINQKLLDALTPPRFVIPVRRPWVAQLIDWLRAGSGLILEIFGLTVIIDKFREIRAGRRERNRKIFNHPVER